MSSTTAVTPENTVPLTPPTTAPRPSKPTAGVTSRPSVDSGAEAQPATVDRGVSGAGAAGFAIPLAAAFSFPNNQRGRRYAFRDNADVQYFLRYFAQVELIECTAVLFASKVFNLSSNGTSTRVIRHGFAPRTVVTHTTTSDGTVYGAGAVTARLNTAVINPMFGQPHVIHGDSSTFPPGMQLDFRAVETRHPYVSYLVVNDVPAANETMEFVVQLDFVVQVSGQNFGGQGL